MTLCDAVALQIGAEPLLTVAVLCNSTASRPKANPLRAFARYFHAAPSRFDSSQCHCQTMRCRSAPRPCIPVRVGSLLCHSIAVPCGAGLRRCFSGHIKATRFDAQPSRVTASQYFAFTMRNVSQLLHFSATPVSAFPLRCRDTHRPAKPLLFFWFQNRTQPALCSS